MFILITFAVEFTREALFEIVVNAAIGRVVEMLVVALAGLFWRQVVAGLRVFAAWLTRDVARWVAARLGRAIAFVAQTVGALYERFQHGRMSTRKMADLACSLLPRLATANI